MSSPSGTAKPVASSPPRITLPEVRAFLEAQRARLQAGENRIDLSDYVDVDSSALAALLALRREREALEFVGVGDNLRKLAALYDVEEILFR